MVSPLSKTKKQIGGDAGFPDIITNLPEAEVTCQGSKAWILQAESMQMVFFEFQEGGKVMDHSHSYPQWGLVINGTMELRVDGKSRMVRKGDEYLIPPRAIHSAIFPCKTRLMDLFCEKERYKKKM